MSLPLPRSFEPQEASTADELPSGGGWRYEPKWDGFRCLAFRDGDTVDLRSKAGKPLTRYFPELVEALLALRAKQFVIDGEIVVTDNGALSFDALLQRVHPAASRIEKLSRETPAGLVVFDLLVDAKGKDLTAAPLSARVKALASFAKQFKGTTVALSPGTSDIRSARRWLTGRSGTDGVMAKRLDCPYATGTRDAMVKVKRKRTADCVVGGFRYSSAGKTLGSLLLGLYDAGRLLHHVGFTSNVPKDERAKILRWLEKHIVKESFTGKAPGGPSRWAAVEREWFPVKPEMVIEVGYDHVSNERFRHGTSFVRERPDKAPRQCTYQQIMPIAKRQRKRR
ncbi:MAG: putative ligase [Gemmatimonadetes bacterium]|nr:putative ligase [Gemmatimonadota bacterium]